MHDRKYMVLFLADFAFCEGCESAIGMLRGLDTQPYSCPSGHAGIWDRI